jgi:hypothetical protein
MRISKFWLWIILLLLRHSIAHAEPTALAEEADPSLVEILAGMEIVAERFDRTDATMPYMLRIIRVRPPGECGTSPETCPKESVYIAISSRDEFPDQKVYRLPEAYHWELHLWSHFPRNDTPDDSVVFTMAKTVIAEDKEKGWWMTEYYVVRANTHSASVEKR